MQLLSPPLVRPRCRSPETGDVVLLEDEVREFVERRRCGAIGICGGPGSGKTTALECLESAFADCERMQFIDGAEPGEITALRFKRIVVFSSDSAQVDATATLHLEPWSDDELIEYLLAKHPAECGDVMRRVLADERRGDLEGSPQQWAIALSRMATGAEIKSAAEALRNEFEPWLADERIRRLACEHALMRNLAFDTKAFETPQQQTQFLGELVTRHERLEGELAALNAGFRFLQALRWPSFSLSLAAELLRDELVREPSPKRFADSLSEPLLKATAQLIRQQPAALASLRGLSATEACQSTCVSLLHACGESWRPGVGKRANLAFAHLKGATWPRQRLTSAKLMRADLSDSDLNHAALDAAQALEVKLAGANLSHVDMTRISARGGDFTRGRLLDVRASLADLAGATLHQAKCDGGNFTGASFAEADLTKATFRRANLTAANFQDAKICGADFRAAILDEAKLADLPMGKADWRGASFVAARMSGVDLEGVELPDANFEDAELRDATLTNSRMTGANFLGANLRGTRLAHVHWEGANLRDADFRKSTFHLGTSRSGLLITPYASEGTRTGFYTDEYAEQHFKRPEDIRLANLRGADLRGALIDGVDFYLVDLRDALYTDDQLRHFRDCRAILSH